LLLTSLTNPVHQVTQSRQTFGVRTVDAFPEQPAQGIHQIAVAHELVGHGAHQIVGAEIVDLLGAVPAGITSAVSGECHNRWS
jgi:hypothetical protein